MSQFSLVTGFFEGTRENILHIFRTFKLPEKERQRSFLKTNSQNQSKKTRLLGPNLSEMNNEQKDNTPKQNQTKGNPNTQHQGSKIIVMTPNSEELNKIANRMQSRNLESVPLKFTYYYCVLCGKIKKYGTIENVKKHLHDDHQIEGDFRKSFIGQGYFE